MGEIRRTMHPVKGHYIILYKRDLKIGCRTRPIEWWIEEDDDGNIVPTEQASNYAKRGGYKFNDILWFLQKLEEWRDDGDLTLKPKGLKHVEGKIEGGPEWTTDPRAVKKKGDIIFKFKNKDDRDKWTDDPLGKSHLAETSFFIHCTSGEELKWDNIILLKTSEKRR